MPLREIEGRRPKVGEGAYVDESALLIGEVVVGRNASVWPRALLRADDDSVELGEGSAVMDMAFVEAPKGRPVRIGKDCLVSHCARLHGCVLENGVTVGIGATILDGARIGSGTIVAAGSLVPPGKQVPASSLVMGMPAELVRGVEENDVDRVRRELSAVHEKARRYASAGLR